MTDRQLFDKARNAAENAYAPYSRFCVGAAVLCEDGSVFTGCNVENASYSLSMCAERVAVFKAVEAGHRRLAAVAVASAQGGDCLPCGSCLQVLQQFAAPDMRVILQGQTLPLSQLLPHPFVLEEQP